ncbi:MAG: transcriptional regulator [Cyanobacteria bacterium QH_2_48_84]|nr:MAG: transcriptional regulator [Cyanobacteria bacterium QH_2_48_84]
MNAKAQNKLATARTRGAIINLLKQEGSMDAPALAERLEVTAMAVRQHLYDLQKERLVTYTEQQRSMGRPAKLWQLTTEANRFFPERYAELSLNLIHSIREVFGEEGLTRLLEIQTRQKMEAYQAQMPENGSLEKRVEALAALRTEEGYMAEVEQSADGSFLLIENHCPICTAAMACKGLCSSELEVFRSILGEDALVERTEHIVAGERRCVYQVKAF